MVLIWRCNGGGRANWDARYSPCYNIEEEGKLDVCVFVGIHDIYPLYFHLTLNPALYLSISIMIVSKYPYFVLHWEKLPRSYHWRSKNTPKMPIIHSEGLETRAVNGIYIQNYKENVNTSLHHVYNDIFLQQYFWYFFRDIHWCRYSTVH